MAFFFLFFFFFSSFFFLFFLPFLLGHRSGGRPEDSTVDRPAPDTDTDTDTSTAFWQTCGVTYGDDTTEEKNSPAGRDSAPGTVASAVRCRGWRRSSRQGPCHVMTFPDGGWLSIGGHRLRGAGVASLVLERESERATMALSSHRSRPVSPSFLLVANLSPSVPPTSPPERPPPCQPPRLRPPPSVLKHHVAPPTRRWLFVSSRRFCCLTRSGRNRTPAPSRIGAVGPHLFIEVVSS